MVVGGGGAWGEGRTDDRDTESRNRSVDARLATKLAHGHRASGLTRQEGHQEGEINLMKCVLDKAVPGRAGARSGR